MADFVTPHNGTETPLSLPPDGVVDRFGLLLIRFGQWVTKRGLRLAKPGRQW